MDEPNDRRSEATATLPVRTRARSSNATFEETGLASSTGNRFSITTFDVVPVELRESGPGIGCVRHPGIVADLW
jgi:hypothetical protein